MEKKRCTRCGEVKSYDEFSRSNGGRIGARCKKCMAAVQSEFHHANAHRINTKRSARVLLKKARERGIDVKIIFEGVEL